MFIIYLYMLYNFLYLFLDSSLDDYGKFESEFNWIYVYVAKLIWIQISWCDCFYFWEEYPNVTRI